MAEISNNLIASLLVIAILVSGVGVFTLANLRITVTGRAPLEYGTANVSITGAVAIDMVRNVTDFGDSILAGAGRILDTQSQNNCGGLCAFDDGSEANGTNVAGCDGTEALCAFPFVVENEGNVNVSLNISADTEASSWIHSGAGAYFKGKSGNVSGQTGSCSADYGSGYGEGSWTALNVSETVVCSDLDYRDTPEIDKLRIHFRLSIPSDAVGPKGEIINIGAISSA